MEIPWRLFPEEPHDIEIAFRAANSHWKEHSTAYALIVRKDAVAPFAESIGRHARAHGVAPERILFAPDRPPAEHLARLSLADLFLDSFPFSLSFRAIASWIPVSMISSVSDISPSSPRSVAGSA